MKVLIAGSGITGPSLALGLKKAGMDVSIYEALPALKDAGAGFMVAPNGLRMLDRYLSKPLFNKIKETGNEISRFDAHYYNGKYVINREMSLKEAFGYNPIGIKRYDYHRLAVDQVKYEKINILYGKKVAKYENLSHGGVKVYFEDGTIAEGDLLIGCDGLHSNIRKQMHGDQDPIFTGTLSLLALSKTDYPEGSHLKNAIVNVFGPHFNFGTYELGNNIRMWFVSQRVKEIQRENWYINSVEEKRINELKELIKDWNSPIKDIVDKTFRCIQWGIFDRPHLPTWHEKNVVLLGDAAHPMAPHLGQGANSSLEDCAVLCDLLSKVKDKEHIEKVLEEFQNKRLPRTSKLVENSRKMGRIGYPNNPILRIFRDAAMKIAFGNFYNTLTKPIFGYDLK